MNPGLSFTLMRVIPVAVLVVVALGAQQWFGLARLPAAGLGLAVAIAVRLILPRIWPQN